MYFGLSFSRVGFDFRPLLAPIFEKTILAQFNKLVAFEANAKVGWVSSLPCGSKIKT